MKKVFLFMTLASVTFTSCSKDDDDTSDEIVGTWSMESNATLNGTNTTNYLDEWVFKSDNTGNYKKSTNGEVDDQSAFTWSKSEEIYTVKYTEEDFSDVDIFKIGELVGKKTLEYSNGTIVALKE